jgi:hypothetical protein
MAVCCKLAAESWGVSAASSFHQNNGGLAGTSENQHYKRHFLKEEKMKAKYLVWCVVGYLLIGLVFAGVFVAANWPLEGHAEEWRLIGQMIVSWPVMLLFVIRSLGMW